VVDVSAWAEQPLVSQTLVLTAETFDGGGQRAVSPAVTLGLDRLPPVAGLTTAMILSPTAIITETPVLSLTIVATDETAGVTHLALGQLDWRWEGESLSREEVGGLPVGQIISDTAALNGQALQATVAADPGGVWSSDPISLPPGEQYRAYFRLKVADSTLADEVALLETIDPQSGEMIGLRRLRGVDFRAGDSYQEVPLDFVTPTSGTVRFQITFQDKADLTLDRLIVVEYPISFTASPTYPALDFRLKVIDGAGNVSEDLLVEPSLSFEQRLYLPLVVK
jgi:hypothetical protein